jgi:hypothetical protein
MTNSGPTPENEGKTGIAAENSVAGLNDNLEFLGKQLHVQTERIGFPAPRIVTQVFINGRIVFSKKSEILPQGDEPQEFPKLQELMRTQHFQIIREIEAKQKRILSTNTIP